MERLILTGMKGSPRFREGTAYIRTKYQPAHIKYPLIAFHAVASVNAYDAENLNVDENVSAVQLFCLTCAPMMFVDCCVSAADTHERIRNFVNWVASLKA